MNTSFPARAAVDMPELVRAYLNSFLGLHTVLCTRGPKASQLITSQVMNDLCDPSSCKLYAVDTDANGGVQNVVSHSGRRSRFASGRNDPPSTSSVSGTLNCGDTIWHLKSQLTCNFVLYYSETRQAAGYDKPR